MGWPSTGERPAAALGVSERVQAVQGGAVGWPHGGRPRTTVTEVMGGGVNTDVWGSQGLGPLGFPGKGREGMHGHQQCHPPKFFCSVH